jgi:uroporphyrinogen decarboxylase
MNILQNLTSRQRVTKALNHQEPDKVPIDFGGTDITSIQLGPYKKLAKLLGCEVEKPIFLHDLMQQQTEVSMKIADRMHSDVRFVYLGYPKQFRDDVAYDGTPVQVPEGFQPVQQSNGDLLVMDSKGKPMMKMPKDGFFFDFPYHNLAECKTIADIESHRVSIERFNVSSWHDYTNEEMGKKAKAICESTDKYVIGLFAGHVFQAGQVLRGWAQFPLDLGTNPGLADSLMEILVDGHIKNFNEWYQHVGQWVDAIEMTDDMGTQSNTWVSPAMYRKQIKPHHNRLFQHIRKTAPNLTIFLHSCGSVYDLIPDFIEMGVQVLNPLQYTAKKMELVRLKSEFGKDLSFWGGGCDSQKILFSGTPQDVEEEVKKNLDIMAPGGGYVFASIHNITEGVPTENILAMFEAAHNFGAY